MSYASASIVCGINLKNTKFKNTIKFLEEKQLVEVEYSGSGEDPVYIGISNSGIKQGQDLSAKEIIKLLQDASTDESFQEVKRQIKTILDDPAPEITDKFKDWLRKQQPSVFITWGTE